MYGKWRTGNLRYRNLFLAFIEAAKRWGGRRYDERESVK